MATIDVQQIENDLIEYADFEEVGSVARARKFQTAAKRWLILRPSQSTGPQGASLAFSHDEIGRMIQRANDYIAANDETAGSSRVSFFSVQNFR